MATKVTRERCQACGQPIKIAQTKIDRHNPPKQTAFGNRCKFCGGYIDEGGICNCGFDHENRVALK